MFQPFPLCLFPSSLKQNLFQDKEKHRHVITAWFTVDHENYMYMGFWKSAPSHQFFNKIIMSFIPVGVWGVTQNFHIMGSVVPSRWQYVIIIFYNGCASSASKHRPRETKDMYQLHFHSSSYLKMVWRMCKWLDPKVSAHMETILLSFTQVRLTSGEGTMSLQRV